MLRVTIIPLTFCYATVFFEAVSSTVIVPKTSTSANVQPHSSVAKEELLEHSNTSSSALKSFQNISKHSKNPDGVQHKNSTSVKIETWKHRIRRINSSLPILYKIHSTITRSKDAVWAAVTLTFICVVLLLAVAQSGMWKDYHGSEAQGIPLPNFNERVPFQDVMRHKMRILKELLQKGKKSTRKKNNDVELESLLTGCDIEPD